MDKNITNAELLTILEQSDNLHEATELISILTQSRQETLIIERIGHGPN